MPFGEATFELTRGTSPLLISVPHAGTELTPELIPRLTPVAQTLPDTDWHVEKLYAPARSLGVGILRPRLSRYVIDLNRDPTGASLYPGSSTTELCPVTSFALEPLYLTSAEPNAAEIDARTGAYYWPYHHALAAELARLKSEHGFAILLEGHSIRAEVPRFFEGRLPDLNLGTNSGLSAAPELEAAARSVLEASRFSCVTNGRFKGGYITRRFGEPQNGVHALQLEIAQATYMREGPPFAWDEALAAPLSELLLSFVEQLAAWRPVPATGGHEQAQANPHGKAR